MDVRTLETVGDELVLQQVLLRLMQSRLPLYAQIRHGPLEYGKDIACLVEVDGRTRLEMYQVKAGNISTPVWRKSRDELEEMYQVELPAVQLSVEPDEREGILIFNGHLNANVEPIVEGWLAEQLNDHGRRFRLMNIDQIVNWVVQNNLISDLRQALDEAGVAII
jgi:hypothetical protein